MPNPSNKRFKFTKSSTKHLDGSSSTSLSAARSVPSNLKGVFCGSGSDAMNNSLVVQAILDLVDKQPEDVNVLYLGTATYDIEGFFIRQTERFVEMGCHVRALKLVNDVPSNMHDLIDDADVLVVGGGNTLFALDRWRKLGIVPSLQQAAERGAVLTGGSAGAICWFDGGHSNAADPMTYKDIRMKKFANRSPKEIVDEIYSYGASSDDSSDDEEDEEEINNAKEWQYFRVSALGFLPGLVSPHLDRVQSNGILRARDFDRCLLQHSGERGIGIDHYAALIVDGKNYRILSLPDKEGTLKDGDFVEDGSGKPWVWMKQVTDNRVVTQPCPSEGCLKDILRTASTIVEDLDEIRKCRLANPDDGPLPASVRQ